MNRRDFFGAAGKTLALAALGKELQGTAADVPKPGPPRQAQIAITFDLEMARNFPRWEDTHWDFEKGNLNAPTKEYAIEAARRVKARGGRIHFFLVGRVLEQADVDWLEALHAEGHPIGNHTYDHVYLLATKPEEIQFRFQRAPWLVENRSPAEVIRNNIELCSRAMVNRLGFQPDGFRTPGGFARGLHGRLDIQEMLLDLGFRWASCTYPPHPYSPPGTPPTREILDGIVDAQERAQPFLYPSGLVDVPMSPISDVGAFRTCRWSLDSFLEAVGAGVDRAIARGAAFDFLAHPSVLYPNDPDFRVIDLIGDRVQRSRELAKFADLNELSKRALN